jgi:hypothetical protein
MAVLDLALFQATPDVLIQTADDPEGQLVQRAGRASVFPAILFCPAADH